MVTPKPFCSAALMLASALFAPNASCCHHKAQVTTLPTAEAVVAFQIILGHPNIEENGGNLSSSEVAHENILINES